MNSARQHRNIYTKTQLTALLNVCTHLRVQRPEGAALIPAKVFSETV